MLFHQIIFAQSINISYPVEGNKVVQFPETIKFQSNVSINKNSIPVVFIQDPLQQWWPYLGAQSINETRISWILRSVQFGIGNNISQRFKIQIIVVSQNQIDNGIQIENQTLYIEQNSPVTNRQIRFLLRQKYIRSNVVSVVRE